jgi:hypothetical protein
MGYFSNGSEGADYEAQWCDRCLHQETCAVWLAHLVSNYKECNNPNSILHMLIPQSADGLSNERCRMFVDKGLLSDLALERYAFDQSQPTPSASGETG